MKKLRIIKTALYIIFFTHNVTFAMVSGEHLGHPDIRCHIYKNLDIEDQQDFRLVCKNWAVKGAEWTFMPDSIEKKYDKIIKKQLLITRKDKAFILFSLTLDNDYNSVKWVTDNNSKGIDYSVSLIKNKYISTKIKLSSCLFAIAHNNQEIAKLLITSNLPKHNQSWKSYYKTVTLPTPLEQCFYPSHNRDFSFLAYIAATWLDNAHNLKELYKKKAPLKLGHSILIYIAICQDCPRCLDVILENEIARTIIKKDALYFFMTALNKNAQSIAQKLIETKQYDINYFIENNRTILDIYYYEDLYKNNIQAQALLENLGAKTGKEIEKEKSTCCCSVQ